MDSATALAWAKSQPNLEVLGALSYYYGSKHNEQEWKKAKWLACYYQVPIQRIHLPFIADTFKSDLLKTGGDIPDGHYADPIMKKTVVPFRNGIMLSLSAGYAESFGAKGLILGNHAGDHAIYPDCRKEFIEAMASAITEGTYARLNLISPFCEVDKSEIVRLGAKLSVPYKMTYSCYKGEDLHCGKCGTCYERKEAFLNAGVVDPTEYSV